MQSTKFSGKQAFHNTDITLWNARKYEWKKNVLNLSRKWDRVRIHCLSVTFVIRGLSDQVCYFANFRKIKNRLIPPKLPQEIQEIKAEFI